MGKSNSRYRSAFDNDISFDRHAENKKKKKKKKKAKTQYVKEYRKSISFPKIRFHRPKRPSFDRLSS